MSSDFVYIKLNTASSQRMTKITCQCFIVKNNLSFRCIDHGILNSAIELLNIVLHHKNNTRFSLSLHQLNDPSNLNIYPYILTQYNSNQDVVLRKHEILNRFHALEITDCQQGNNINKIIQHNFHSDKVRPIPYSSFAKTVKPLYYQENIPSLRNHLVIFGVLFFIHHIIIHSIYNHYYCPRDSFRLS